MPLYGENYLTRLTRGDADALPRAKCFWTFSPRVNRNRTMPILPENVIANNAIISSCKNSGTTPHAPQGQPAHSPTQSEATRRVNQSTDVSPCRGKSVKRDYFKQKELQSILPCNSFNQTMFNQFLVLLDNEFLCCVSNHESINSAWKVSKVKPYALCACRKVKLS